MLRDRDQIPFIDTRPFAGAAPFSVTSWQGPARLAFGRCVALAAEHDRRGGMAKLIERIAADRQLLWLDGTGYAEALLAGGAAPWLKVDDCVAWQRKTQGLLRSDVVMLPLAQVVSAFLRSNLDLAEAMAGRRRTLFPLKTLLGDEKLRALVSELSDGLRSSFRTLLFALGLPSPRRWVRLAHELAFPGEAVEVDAEAVDSGSTYVADFLRSFAHCGIDAVLLEEDDESALAADVHLYQPVLNVAAHYRWDLGVRLPPQSPAWEAGVDFCIASRPAPGIAVGIVVPSEFWAGSEPPDPPDGGFRFAEIPRGTEPEIVLERLMMLRRPAA